MKIIAVAGRMGTGKDTVAEILAAKGFQRVALADVLKQIVHRVFGFDRETLFGPSDARNRTVHFTDDEWCDIFFRGGDFTERLCTIMMAGSNTRKNTSNFNGQDVRRAFHRYLQWCRQRDIEGRFSARVALQLLGTEFGRTLRDDVWIVNLEYAIHEIGFGYPYDPLTGLDYERFSPDQKPTGVVITDCRFPNEAEAVHQWSGEVSWIDASKRLVIPPSTHASEPDREAFEGLLTGDIDNNGSLPDLEREVLRVAG